MDRKSDKEKRVHSFDRSDLRSSTRVRYTSNLVGCTVWCSVSITKTQCRALTLCSSDRPQPIFVKFPTLISSHPAAADNTLNAPDEDHTTHPESRLVYCDVRH